ncbi:MAG TPA: 3-deoxy-7-phosphoheptulonate synthase, partial [Candidatus Wallbacteria bacterium]|nr:3-deoxy-7-phosphoheptulonate synthase [Candidatus Wallbacteria bacterium]
VIEVGTVKIGGNQVQIIAGPCSIESYEQTSRIAAKVASVGIKLFRGGAFKPRTSPYSFQGLNEEGLKILKDVTKENGMYAVTEFLDVRHADMIREYADIVQIGTRNAMNYPLLKEAGRMNKPVLLKRGISSTIKEFLLCAEYIMCQGNERVILCERGIRTFENAYRSTLDLAAVSIIKELSHLPIIVDPSHASGAWNLVSDLSLASIAAGADGVMIEVHDIPSEALSDSRQSLKPEKLSELAGKISKIASCLGRSFMACEKGSDKI